MELNHGKRNIGEKIHGRGFIEEDSWESIWVGGLWMHFAHLGSIWEASGSWDISGRLWGEVWKARATKGGPEASWR